MTGGNGGNECHDDKGKFCSEGGSANVERTSDTRADQPATSVPVEGFTSVESTLGARYRANSGQAEIVQTVKGFELRKVSRGALSRRKAPVLGKYKSAAEAAADYKRIYPHG